MATKICIVLSALFCIVTCGPLTDSLLGPHASTTVCETSPKGLDILGLPLPYSGLPSLPLSTISPLGFSGYLPNPRYQPMNAATTVCETTPNIPLGIKMTAPQMSTTVCETTPNMPGYPMPSVPTVCETTSSYNMPLGFKMTAPQMSTTVCETTPNMPVYPMPSVPTVCETTSSYNIPLGLKMTAPQMSTTVCETTPNQIISYPLGWGEASGYGVPYGFMMPAPQAGSTVVYETAPNAFPYGYPLGRSRLTY